MSEPDNPVPLTAIVRVPRLDPSEIPEMVELSNAPLGMLVREAPDPLKVVADRVPLLELKVRFEPVLGAWFPVASVANTGKQVVS